MHHPGHFPSALPLVAGQVFGKPPSSSPHDIKSVRTLAAIKHKTGVLPLEAVRGSHPFLPPVHILCECQGDVPSYPS
jgi:hypothetical protein